MGHLAFPDVLSSSLSSQSRMSSVSYHVSKSWHHLLGFMASIVWLL